ncbi:MAG: hypothetical protein AAGI23_12830 [Bacteroidota bacterium]
MDRKEMTRFCAFVDSPYFNKHQDVQALVAHFNTLYPDFKSADCHKENITKAVFGTVERVSDLAVVFTYTKRLYFQFLNVEKSTATSVEQQLNVLEQLRERGHNKTYEQQLHRLQKHMAAQLSQDIEDHFQYYQLAEERNTYFEQQRKYENDNSLMQKQQSLNTFFIAQKLRDACEILIRQRTLKMAFTDPVFDSILDNLDQQWTDYQLIPTIAVYRQIYELLHQQTFETYTQTLATLHQHAATFSLAEQQRAYQYVQNFCATQINAGKAEYLQHLFDLLRVQLEKKLLFENGYLPEWHYKNIVTAGLRLGEQQWVRSFIDDYQEHLHPEQREYAYGFNLGSYFFYYKEYKKALQQLLYLNISDVRYAITAKSMLLYIYYELEETEALLALTKTFKQYLIRRKGLAKDYSQGVRNLVELTRQLATLRSRQAYENTEKWRRQFSQLQQKIAAEEHIVNRKWLLEKVGELT